MEIVLATGNPHKLEEIRAIAKDINFELELVGDDFDPVENGSSFKENSYIKAYEAAKLTGKLALADDTGLCVDALNGEPGLYSARYAPTQKEKIEKILNKMKGKADRSAHFECNMTLVNPKGEILYSTVGRVEGYITENADGVNGFGYDPIFFVPELNKTMAKMTAEEKNSLSHRARALLPMIEWINKNLL